MRLIVGVVEGASGDDAVALAERCAHSAGATLDLCTVVRSAPAVGHAAHDEAALATLRAVQERLGDDIVADVHVCQDDSPARGLATMARRLAADAVVIGGEPTAGGVGSTLLHASPFPIILAARASAHRGVARLGAVTCAVGPRSQDGLVRMAALCARRADTPLRVMSLLVPADRAQDETSSRVDLREAAHRRLADATALAQACLPVDFPVSSVLVEGDSIEDAAARLEWGPGDVVVLGAGRPTSDRRADTGSAIATMLRTLNVAAVVVPADARAHTQPINGERQTPTTR